jgi:hypothetical protein
MALGMGDSDERPRRIFPSASMNSRRVCGERELP